jgi:predicted porin
MKKTLVALASLASVTAFAQTSVVIDGFIDRGYLTSNSSLDTADSKTIASSSGTTTVGIKVNEDLGGGLTAGLSINTDWSELGGATAANAVANAQASGFANSQSFLHITSKDMGTLRLGAPNTFTLTNATGISAPAFSTGVGSQYSSAYAIAAGAGTGTSGRGGTVDFTGTNTAIQNWSGARAIRIANTIQYSSPSFNGVSIHAGYTQANNNVTTISGAGNTPGVTETALRYTNGPVDAMYSTIKYTVGSNGISQTTCVMTSGVCVLTADVNAAQTSQQNLLGVAYTVMPNLKVNFGSGTYSSSTATYQGSSKNYGATYTMGQIDLMLLTSASDDKSTANFDKKMTGYGLNYNLSKQTRAYVRMDNLNLGSNVTAVAGSSVKRTAFGVSKSF